MKNRFFLKAVAVLSMIPALSFAQVLQVDSAHSSVRFEVKHLMISEIPGHFNDFSGTIDWNEKDMTKSKVDFTVKVASIDTHVPKRDEHLRTDDFFNAEKFPEAKFVSTKIKKNGKNEYKMEGNLTIRDVTKKVKWDVKYLGKADDPASKTQKAVFRADTEINRKDFGVNYGPNAVVSDKVELDVNLEAIIPAATPAK